jgi:hypothetical protein
MEASMKTQRIQNQQERKDRTTKVRDLGRSAAAVVKGGRHRQRKDDDGPTVTWDLTDNKA